MVAREFPQTPIKLDDLSGLLPGLSPVEEELLTRTEDELDGLLKVYGQPVHGSLEQRWRRFANFIGIYVDLV